MTNVDTPSAKSTSRTIIRNTAFGMVAQIILKIASFIFQITVINNLGDSNWGKYNIVIGWATLFGVLGDLGITQYLTREIARDHSNSKRLFWNAVVLRLMLAIVAAIITAISAVMIGYSSEIVIGCILFTASYLFQSILAPLTGLVVGNERVDISSLFAVITQILFMVFGAIVMAMGLGFEWIILANVINVPLVAVSMYWVVKRNKLGPPEFSITTSDWLPLLRSSIPFGAIQMAHSFAYRMDTIILSRTNTAEVVGWYNSAYTLTLTLLTITRAYNEAVLPSLSRAFVTNSDSAKEWYFRSVQVMIFLTLPLCIGGMLMSDKIVATLYKPEYAPAAIALAILIWDIPFNIFHAFGGAIGVSMKKERKVSNIFVIMSVLNFVLNLILIVPFGLIGASFATVLTDFWGAAQFYLLYRYEFGSGLQFKRVLRLAICALMMGIVVWLLHDLAALNAINKWLRLSTIILVSGLSYLIMVWFSGAFSTEERNRVTTIVKQRLKFSKQ